MTGFFAAATSGGPTTTAINYSPNFVPTFGNLNIYVNATTGNDTTGNGTMAFPFATITHALIIATTDNICSTAGGSGTFIRVADGTYKEEVPYSTTSSLCEVHLIGDVTTPTNCIIQPPGGNCVYVTNGATLTISGFMLDPSVSGGAGLLSTYGGNISAQGNMAFGGGSANAMIYATAMAQIQLFASACTISAGSANFIAVLEASYCVVQTAFTITGTPAFSEYFAWVSDVSLLNIGGTTFSGSATGVRYLSQTNSLLNTGGGGASFLPGNSAGSASNGGIYL